MKKLNIGKVGTGIFTYNEYCLDCGKFEKVDINGFCKDCYIEDVEKEIKKEVIKKLKNKEGFLNCIICEKEFPNYDLQNYMDKDMCSKCITEFVKRDICGGRTIQDLIEYYNLINKIKTK